MISINPLTRLYSYARKAHDAPKKSTKTKKEPQGLFFVLERITGLEPATSTLARWRSTKWAKSAKMVPPVGIEPTTQGFSVPCSTNWATEAILFERWRLGWGSNPRPLAWQASALTNWATKPFLSWKHSVLSVGKIKKSSLVESTGLEPVTLCL